MAPTLDIDAVRAAFPALSSGFLYADNAGGSQCLADAAARRDTIARLWRGCRIRAHVCEPVRVGSCVRDGAAAR